MGGILCRIVLNDRAYNKYLEISIKILTWIPFVNIFFSISILLISIILDIFEELKIKNMRNVKPARWPLHQKKNHLSIDPYGEENWEE